MSFLSETGTVVIAMGDIAMMAIDMTAIVVMMGIKGVTGMAIAATGMDITECVISIHTRKACGRG